MMGVVTDVQSSDQSTQGDRVPITVAHGDGIGPEIMDATLRILEAAKARLDIQTIEIGEAVYKRGIPGGIEPDAFDSLRRTGVFLKAPITTPQGGGFKSLNVTVRKGLGLFANIRPCMSLAPFVPTHHPEMDLIIVRENEEGLYGGIEHRQTQEVVQCLRLLSHPGCDRIVRFAFEYAQSHGRKKVTCFSKDNIMKMTDGMFHRVFDEVAGAYPDLEKEHWIIDIGSARVAARPGMFDVVVMPNLYGDIVSDIAAEVAGSVGLGGSANIGETAAMFEAIHGSAPDIAGQGIANPSGLLNGAIMMLLHIGQGDVAQTIHNAWLRTIEDGIHTGDIYSDAHSTAKVGTQDFADAVIERLGQNPEKLKPVSYPARGAVVKLPPYEAPPRAEKVLKGVDVFVDFPERDPEALAALLQGKVAEGLKLQIIANRGQKVWPEGLAETFCTDHWACRFVGADDGANDGAVDHALVAMQLATLAEAGVDFVKTENLYDFDGQQGYSVAQGQ